LGLDLFSNKKKRRGGKMKMVVYFEELTLKNGQKIIDMPVSKDFLISIGYNEEEVNNLFREQLVKEKKKKLNTITDRYFYAEAKTRGDYLNMGEIIYDAQAGDPDATFLKQLYDAVWAKEEELEKQLEEMTLDQLLELDLEAWAKEAYNQVKAELENQSENNQTENTES
jgi:hypothetical protein